ncbi:MAG: iron ABC transporter permease [Planctomycetes bacterium]|nr:iron ABC transporter permease [Planctomycetota bacterium]
MTSCLWLERPGKVRWLAALALLVLPLLPVLPLCWQAVTNGDALSLGWPFSRSLLNSLLVALIVSSLTFLVGLPAGVMSALYEFSGRRLFLSVVALPLLAPSFLWAIGWSALAARLGPWATGLISGYTGCVLVFFAGAFALVLYAAMAATLSLTGSQIEAARLAGGEKAVLHYAVRHAAVPALLASVLAGVLTLSDPGPGQILLLPTAASEILTSFAAHYDFEQAARQCLVLGGLVVLLSLPLVFVAAPIMATELLARQMRPLHRVRPARAHWLPIGGAVLTAILFAGPVAGILLPIPGGLELERATREVLRTGMNTLLYGFGAGLIAAVMGFVLAGVVGRDSRLRAITLGLCLTAFTLPPALLAFGIIQASSALPAWTDLFLRSRFVVCLALALRFFPIAVVLGMRAWGSMSQTWVHAAAVHGISGRRYLRSVAVPWLLPSVGISILLVGLLAMGEIGAVLLLHPPGQSSLPLTIFAIMANAPEALVASLCLAYLTLAAAVLLLIWRFAGRYHP